MCTPGTYRFADVEAYTDTRITYSAIDMGKLLVPGRRYEVRWEEFISDEDELTSAMEGMELEEDSTVDRCWCTLCAGGTTRESETITLRLCDRLTEVMELSLEEPCSYYALCFPSVNLRIIQDDGHNGWFVESNVHDGYPLALYELCEVPR